MKKRWAFWVFWAAVAAAGFLVLCQVGYSDGDDAFFLQYTGSMDFFSYLSWRYESWVGRMAAEALVYLTFHLGIWFWRAVNALMLALLPAGILRLAAKTAKKQVERPFGWEEVLACPQGDYRRMGLVAAVCAVSGYLLMDAQTFGYAAVWVNGSIFYTWTFTCGVWALMPYADLVSCGEADGRTFLYSLPCAVIAAMSVEQMGAVLIAFEALALLYCFVTRRHANRAPQSGYFAVSVSRGSSRYAAQVTGRVEGTFSVRSRQAISVPALLQLLLSAAAFAVLFTAPGNELRVAQETAQWMPEFASMPLRQHLFITAQWLLSSFARENRLFLCCIWIAGIFLLLQKRGRGTLDFFLIAAAGVFAAASLLPFAGVTALSDMGMDIPDITACVERVPRMADLTWGNVLALLWWTAALIFTLFFLWRASDYKAVPVLAYLAGVASEAILFFSPTMYSSGGRVYYLTCLLLLFVLLSLSFGVRGKRRRTCLYGIVAALAILHFLSQLPVFLTYLPR